MTRLLSKSEAAKYCNLSATQFAQWVKAGRISPAIPGTNRFDKIKLDMDIDRLSGIATQSSVSALETWKAMKDASRAQRSAQNQQANC
jgi:hypothetical protein